MPISLIIYTASLVGTYGNEDVVMEFLQPWPRRFEEPNSTKRTEFDQTHCRATGRCPAGRVVADKVVRDYAIARPQMQRL